LGVGDDVTDDAHAGEAGLWRPVVSFSWTSDTATADSAVGRLLLLDNDTTGSAPPKPLVVVVG
jgi:hypothetical protein